MKGYLGVNRDFFWGESVRLKIHLDFHSKDIGKIASLCEIQFYI